MGRTTGVDRVAKRVTTGVDTFRAMDNMISTKEREGSEAVTRLSVEQQDKTSYSARGNSDVLVTGTDSFFLFFFVYQWRI